MVLIDTYLQWWPIETRRPKRRIIYVEDPIFSPFEPINRSMDEFSLNTKWIWDVNSNFFENCFSAKELTIS